MCPKRRETSEKKEGRKMRTNHGGENEEETKMDTKRKEDKEKW